MQVNALPLEQIGKQYGKFTKNGLNGVKFEFLNNFGFAPNLTFSAANTLLMKEHAGYTDFMTNFVNYTLDRMKRTKNGRSN